MQQIKNALQADLNGFIVRSGVPELQHAHKLADDYYRQYRVLFQDPSVAKAGSADEADTILNMFPSIMPNPECLQQQTRNLPCFPQLVQAGAVVRKYIAQRNSIVD